MFRTHACDQLRLFGGCVVLAVIISAAVLLPGFSVPDLDTALKRVGVIVETALRE